MTYELMVPLKLLNITNHQNQPGDKLHLENREKKLKIEEVVTELTNVGVTSSSFDGKTVPYNSFMELHVLAGECDL
jgi:hypothetical protein